MAFANQTEALTELCTSNLLRPLSSDFFSSHTTQHFTYLKRLPLCLLLINHLKNVSDLKKKKPTKQKTPEPSTVLIFHAEPTVTYSWLIYGADSWQTLASQHEH